MARNICQGCGSDMGCYDRIPVTEAWHEYCGNCNRKYYEHEEMLRKADDEAREEKRQKILRKYEEIKATEGGQAAEDYILGQYGC